MDKIYSIDYAKTHMGLFLAIFIAVGTTILTLMFVSNGAYFSDIKYLCIGAAILALMCLLSDFTKNRKNKTKISHMQYMLSCPYVTGKVCEIKRIPYFFGKEFKENHIFRAMGRNVVYRVAVSFHSPVTDMEEITVSEPYGINIASYVNNNNIAVHYSQNGEYWIEIK